MSKLAACVAEGFGKVLGVAAYRIYEKTAEGVLMYVVDLLTAENSRSVGVGLTLTIQQQANARIAGCEN